VLRTLLIAGGVVTVALGAAGWLAYNRLKETLVANFDALNAKLDEQDAARTAATARIAEDVQALRDQVAALELDTDDQAKVDEIVNRVQANVDALNAIDPVRADDSNTPTGPNL
jgi:hypothetical protein